MRSWQTHYKSSQDASVFHRDLKPNDVSPKPDDMTLLVSRDGYRTAHPVLLGSSRLPSCRAQQYVAG
jgi:hypothetical protein